MKDKVLAILNGKEITEKDLHETIAKFPPERQSYLQTEEGKKQLLDEIISFELIYNYAKENGMEEDKDYIDQLQKLKREILIQVTIGKLLSKINVTNEEIEEFYNNNKQLFKNEEMVTAKHILVNTVEEANNIVNEIKNGLDFEEAAKKYSTCPSKEAGGNLGEFGRGRMVPEFEKVAFELEVGVVSEPVKTQFGYHIIKVENKNQESVKTLEEVKDNIKYQLVQQRQKEKYIGFTNELKNKYSVELK
ncbi:peptidylprolyl isomerase [Clostridium rectalis]|uniref:peptidylprolyl isomerase n=1 Tax=Clostridium rectalis TaxID=2040295 RepID=UPI000F637F76|nr:peptidylprolyl isomerase [Clostridium rectalis]